MPTYGRWALPAGPAIGIDTRPSTSFLSTGAGWKPGGENWSTPTGSVDTALQDMPMFNASLGLFVSTKSGKPYTGKNPMTGQSYLNGQPTTVTVPYSGGRQINPNDPTQRYQAVNIEKTPELAGTNQTLAAAVNQISKEALPDFSAIKSAYESDIARARESSQAATDISGVTGTLTSAQARYDAALEKAKQDYANALAETAGTQRQIVNEARANLTPYEAALVAERNRYSGALGTAGDAYRQAIDEARRNWAASLTEGRDIYGRQTDESIARSKAAAYDTMLRNIKAYRSVSGTPTSLGSNELAQLVRGSAQIEVPMEQFRLGQRQAYIQNLAVPSLLDIAGRETAKAAQFDPAMAAAIYGAGTTTATNILGGRENVLSRYALPVETAIGAQAITKAGQFDPMIAAQQFQSGTATAQTIQQLSVVTSTMAREDAIRYMQSLGVPEQVRQSILSGNIANAAAVNQLIQASRYQGLQDIMGAQISQPIGTTFVSPGYLGPDRYALDLGNYATGNLTGTNAPVQVSPTVTESRYPGSAILPGGVVPRGDMVWDANNQVYRSKKTGQVIRTPRAQMALPQNASLSLGPQSSSRYDPILGAFVDRFTGQITGYGGQGSWQPNQRFPQIPAGTRYVPESPIANWNMGVQ